MKYKNISAPINSEPLLRALQSVRPNTQLVFTLTKTAPASERTASVAKELFGDKLTIE